MLYVKYVLIFFKFKKKRNYETYWFPLLSCTYWSVVRKFSLIGFLFCSISVGTSQGKVAAGWPQWLPAQDGGFREEKKCELQSQGQGGLDGELPLQDAASFPVNSLQSKTWENQFLWSPVKCLRGKFTFLLKYNFHALQTPTSLAKRYLALSLFCYIVHFFTWISKERHHGPHLCLVSTFFSSEGESTGKEKAELPTRNKLGNIFLKWSM